MNELGGGGRRTRPWNFYPNNKQQQQQQGGGVWKNMNLGGTTTTSNSMNAISFGIVATAILISMFLIMAILEHLFRPSSSNNDPPDGIIITPLESPSASKSSTHLHNMLLANGVSMQIGVLLWGMVSFLSLFILLANSRRMLLHALLKWIQRFSRAHNIGVRAAAHIFTRIGFAVARGLKTQIEMTRNGRDLSVVMPGQKYPSCIAQPAPLLACPTQGFRWHSHHPTFHSFSP